MRESKRVFIGGLSGVWTQKKRFKWEGNGNEQLRYAPTTLGQQISYLI